MAEEIISWRGKMRFIKSILLSFLFFLPTTYYLLPTTCCAEELTITTYYPSPYGSYNELGINKLAVDIDRVAVPSEYAAMQNGDAHIGRSLIVGSGGSGFAYDERVSPLDTRPADGDVIIRGRMGIGTATPSAQLEISGSGTQMLKIHGNVGVNSFTPGKIEFWSDPDTGNLWHPSSIRSIDLMPMGQYVGGLAFSTNGRPAHSPPTPGEKTNETDVMTMNIDETVLLSDKVRINKKLNVSGNTAIGTGAENITPDDTLDLVFKSLPFFDQHLYFSPFAGEMAGKGNLNFTIDSNNDSNDAIFRIGRDARLGKGGTPTELFRVTEGGRVGIGTTDPQARLSIYGPENPTVLKIHSSSGFGSGKIEFWSDPENRADILWRPASIQSIDAGNWTGGLRFIVNGTGKSYRQNELYIMEMNINGIYVNAPIYQRGSLIHPDYVFKRGYKLESIDEHAEYMWKNKHLKAIPKQIKDENGQYVTEIGALNNGILEELEKAHIYIEQLNNEIKKLKKEVEENSARTR